MTTTHATEYQEQVALFEWAAWNEARLPELALLFAIPNGEKRDAVTGARLKRAGVKAGVPDLLLPVASKGYHGLWIELKTPVGRTSPAQERWITTLVEQGYDVAVARSWRAAAWLLCKYLCVDPAVYGVGAETVL